MGARTPTRVGLVWLAVARETRAGLGDRLPWGHERRYACCVASSTMGLAMVAALTAGVSCSGGGPFETVDPGPNYVVPTVTFSPNYFYCVVEPEIIMGGLTGTPCGDNGSHGCHYSDKVPGMALTQLPAPVTCSGSGAIAAPTNMNQVASGTAAFNNLSAVSNQMDVNYMDANIFIWPTNSMGNHPVMVFSPTDTKVTNILMTWSTLR